MLVAAVNHAGHVVKEQNGKLIISIMTVRVV